MVKLDSRGCTRFTESATTNDMRAPSFRASVFSIVSCPDSAMESSQVTFYPALFLLSWLPPRCRSYSPLADHCRSDPLVSTSCFPFSTSSADSGTIFLFAARTDPAHARFQSGAAASDIGCSGILFRVPASGNECRSDGSASGRSRTLQHNGPCL